MNKVKININVNELSESYVEIDGQRLKGVTSVELAHRVGETLPAFRFEVVARELEVTAEGNIEINHRTLSVEDAMRFLHTLKDQLTPEVNDET